MRLHRRGQNSVIKMYKAQCKRPTWMRRHKNAAQQKIKINRFGKETRPKNTANTLTCVIQHATLHLIDCFVTVVRGVWVIFFCFVYFVFVFSFFFVLLMDNRVSSFQRQWAFVIIVMNGFSFSSFISLVPIPTDGRTNELTIDCRCQFNLHSNRFDSIKI